MVINQLQVYNILYRKIKLLKISISDFVMHSVASAIILGFPLSADISRRLLASIKFGKQSLFQFTREIV